MSQIDKIKESINSLAGMALNHRKLDARSKERLVTALTAVNTAPPPKVLLFGVSQAGKSTLLSTIMRGEQFVPIGIGTATTVVPTELWPVASPGEECAVLWLKSPREVLETISEVVLPRLSFKPGQGAEDMPDHSLDSYPEQMVLDAINPSDAGLRALLSKALEGAEAEYRLSLNKGEPAKNGEALVITRALLTYYETYEHEYREGGIDIPLSGINTWLRRPADWLERDEFGEQGQFPYGYDEVKCFYVRRAQLFVRCREGLAGVCLVDAPGYGVTPSDNAVLDREALTADSIILVLGSQGSQITEAQLDQVGQLSKNLSRNPFVLWNAKGVTQEQAKKILNTDLNSIRRVVGLDIPPKRALVTNFLLALRATQLPRFGQLNPLSIKMLEEEAVDKGISVEGAASRRAYVRRYLEDTLRQSYESFTFRRYDAEGDKNYEIASTTANLSENFSTIIGLITQTHKAILLRDCAKEVISVLRQFLFTRPTKEQFDNLERQYTELEQAIPRFAEEAGDRQKKFVGNLKTRTDELKSELMETLWAHIHFRNVKTTIRSQIAHVSSRTYVSSTLRRNIKQLLSARLELWLQQVQKGESDRLRNHLLSGYQSAWLELREKLRPVSEDAEGGLRLPDWQPPKFDLIEFKTMLMEEFTAAVEQKFPNTLGEGFVQTYEELKVDAIKGARKMLNKGRKLLKKMGARVEVKKYPPAQPFNRTAAQAAVSEQVEGFYRILNDQLPDEAAWESAHEAFKDGVNQAFGLNSRNYTALLEQRLAELGRLKKNIPSPLSAGEREYFEQIIERLEPSLVVAEQLLRPESELLP